jgi:hypothetical protein
MALNPQCSATVATARAIFSALAALTELAIER